MSDVKKTIRLGCATGWARDRFEPAGELVSRGNLDYLCCQPSCIFVLRYIPKINYYTYDIRYSSFLGRRNRIFYFYVLSLSVVAI